MTEPEHLDPETTDWPDEWDAEDWWEALSPADLARFGYRRQADLKTAPGYLDEHVHDPGDIRTCWCGAHADNFDDGQRPADFDDEERRP